MFFHTLKPPERGFESRHIQELCHVIISLPDMTRHTLNRLQGRIDIKKQHETP